MPSKVKVKIKSIESQDRGGKEGYMIKGYDATSEKAFNKFVFETTQKGDLTKVAEAMQSANPGEWYEFTVDDSKWKNATYCVRIKEPEGGAPPAAAQSSGGGGTGGKSSYGGGSDKMSKAEWAAKDAKKEASIARNSGLKAAIAFNELLPAKSRDTTPDDIIETAKAFEQYLNPAPVAKKEEAKPAAEKPAVDNPPTGDQNDDIPF